ncbi:MAG: methionyl-tRNA formyltransferase [Promethearchaeota archaeon]
MKIFINVMDEPLFIGKTIRLIINKYNDSIVGINLMKGNPSSVRKGFKKLKDMIIFLLILGLFGSIKVGLKLVYIKIRSLIRIINIENPYSLKELSKKYNIPIFLINDINNEDSINLIKKLKPDIIINQSNSILSKRFLDIPTIGTINRHAALLPKYRGINAPFWALINGDEKAGVSIHFVDEKIDHGPIIVQKEVPIKKSDSYLSLIKRIFDVTPEIFITAIQRLHESNYKDKLIQNDDKYASYCSQPQFKDVLKYYKVRISRIFRFK